MQISEFQTKVLLELFERLDNANISYCVLRNYEGLPYANTAKDTDILISKKNLQKALHILYKVVAKNGGTHAFINKYQNAICCTFFINNGTHPISTKIDYVFNFESRGAIFISAVEILKKKIIHNNIHIIAPVQEAIINWLFPLITGGIVKNKYKDKICKVITTYPDDLKSCLIHILGSKLTAKLWPFLASCNIEETLQYKDAIRRTAWLISLQRKPVSTIIELLHHLYIEIRRRLFPKKQMIVLIGPDGTGKSTTIESLKDRICDLMKWDIAKIKIVHFRPTLLPNLKKLFTFGRKCDTDDDFTNPHRAKPSNFIISLFRLFYYWIDYTIGYYMKIFPLLGRLYIIFFDRYYYDFIVDPARSRIKLPKFISMFFSKFVPNPTLTVYIDNDVEIILKRKQELPADEIARQISEYRSLIKMLPNAISVDGRKSVNEIVEEIAVEYIKRITIPIEKLTQSCK